MPCRIRKYNQWLLTTILTRYSKVMSVHKYSSGWCSPLSSGERCLLRCFCKRCTCHRWGLGCLPCQHPSWCWLLRRGSSGLWVESGGGASWGPYWRDEILSCCSRCGHRWLTFPTGQTDWPSVNSPRCCFAMRNLFESPLTIGHGRLWCFLKNDFFTSKRVFKFLAIIMISGKKSHPLHVLFIICDYTHCTAIIGNFNRVW